MCAAAAAVGIVVDDHVTRLEILQTNLGNRPLDGEEDGTQWGWTELGLGDHLTLAIEDHAGKFNELQ